MAFVAVIPAIGTGIMAGVGMLGTGIGALGAGLGTLGAAASSIPIIGGPLGSLLGAGSSLLGTTATGAAMAPASGLAGLFTGGGFGSLGTGLTGAYGGLDAALGGLLPNLGLAGTVAPSAGWLGSGGLGLLGPQGSQGAAGVPGGGFNIKLGPGQFGPNGWVADPGQALSQTAFSMPNVGPPPTSGGGLWSQLDGLLGGALPGGQPLGEGWLGKGYSQIDNILGGWLPGGIPQGGGSQGGQTMGNSLQQFFGFGKDMSKEDANGLFPGMPSYDPSTAGSKLVPGGPGGPSIFEQGKEAFGKFMNSPFGDMVRGAGNVLEAMDPTEEQAKKGDTKDEIEALRKEIAKLKGGIGAVGPQGAQGSAGSGGIQYGLGPQVAAATAPVLNPAVQAAYAPAGFTASPTRNSPALEALFSRIA